MPAANHCKLDQVMLMVRQARNRPTSASEYFSRMAMAWRPPSSNGIRCSSVTCSSAGRWRQNTNVAVSNKPANKA